MQLGNILDVTQVAKDRQAALKGAREDELHFSRLELELELEVEVAGRLANGVLSGPGQDAPGR